jgi:hypothetical protein
MVLGMAVLSLGETSLANRLCQAGSDLSDNERLHREVLWAIISQLRSTVFCCCCRRAQNHGRNAPKEDEPTADVRAYLVGIEAVVLSQTLGVSAETEVRSQYHSRRPFARAEENPLRFW